MSIHDSSPVKIVNSGELPSTRPPRRRARTRRRRWPWWAITRLLAMGAVLHAGFSLAAPITETFREGDGKGHVSATDVTYLRGDTGINPTYPTRNWSFVGIFASETDNQGGGGDGSGIWRGLLRYPGLIGRCPGQVPPGSTILSATLELWTTNPSNDGVGIHRVIRPWNDTTVNWVNFNNGGVAGIDYGGLTAAFGPSGSAPFTTTVNVTGVVQAWANGLPNEGLIFINGGFDQWAASSDNAAFSQRPRLTVVFEPCCSYCDAESLDPEDS